MKNGFFVDYAFTIIVYTFMITIQYNSWLNPPKKNHLENMIKIADEFIHMAK